MAILPLLVFGNDMEDDMSNGLEYLSSKLVLKFLTHVRVEYHEEILSNNSV